jgi:hypothetical protein
LTTGGEMDRKGEKMPEYLKKFLEGLTDEQADELWLYFDESCDDAALIEVLAESHPLVKVKNEASYEEITGHFIRIPG